MMSNGPCSCLRLFQSGCRSIAAASTSSWRLEDEDVAEAFASEAAQRAPQLALLVRTTCGPKSRSGPRPVALVADSLRQIEDDRDRQHVVLARERDQRLARLRLDVGRVDDRQLRAGAAACAAMKCSTSKASSVADWSFSSSETRPRQQSDERTSVGLKCLRANVDLPEPDAADQDDQGQLGDRRSFIGRTPPSASAAPTSAVLSPDRPKAHARSRTARRRHSPRPGTRARVHSKRWSLVAELARQAASAT